MPYAVCATESPSGYFEAFVGMAHAQRIKIK